MEFVVMLKSMHHTMKEDHKLINNLWQRRLRAQPAPPHGRTTRQNSKDTTS
jgi:hypothetical protein